jgi:dipeptidase E
MLSVSYALEMPLKIVLYSSQETPEDVKVDGELVRLLGAGAKRIAWLGSDFQPGGGWFEAKQRYYRKLGFELENLVAQVTGKPDWDKLLAPFDALHLSGGSTPKFLRLIREHHFAEPLKRFLGNSGTVIGVSAGAILLTPHISTTFESKYGDICPEPEFDLPGLAIVDFLFCPHFEDAFASGCQQIANELEHSPNRLNQELVCKSACL